MKYLISNASEELVAKSIRDEIIQSFYGRLAYHLRLLANISSVTIMEITLYPTSNSIYLCHSVSSRHNLLHDTIITS